MVRSLPRRLRMPGNFSFGVPDGLGLGNFQVVALPPAGLHTSTDTPVVSLTSGEMFGDGHHDRCHSEEAAVTNEGSAWPAPKAYCNQIGGWAVACR